LASILVQETFASTTQKMNRSADNDILLA